MIIAGQATVPNGQQTVVPTTSLFNSATKHPSGSIRNIRRHGKDALDKLVKGGEAGEDDGRRAAHELDELTHTYVTQIDELLKRKEAELLEV